jgi:hypothetical protein
MMQKILDRTGCFISVTSMEETKTPEETYNEAMKLWPAEMTHPIATATADGVLYAIKAFFKHNEIDVSPGTLSSQPGHDFVLGLMSEYRPEDAKEEKEIAYPLTNSFRANWNRALVELTPVLVALWTNGEKDQSVRLVRTIAFGEAIKFFESNRKEIIDAVAKFRGDDIQKEEQAN